MMTSDDIIASMPEKAQAAWREYESHYLGGLGGGRATAARAFKAAWDAAVVACADFMATTAGQAALNAPQPGCEATFGEKPARCARSLATIPRDGRWVWVQRQNHPRVKQRIRLARWVKHGGPTGGRWSVRGTQTTMYDAIIEGWEPVNETV